MNSRGKKEGFGLIELLVAIGVFTIAIVSIAHLFTRARTSSDYSLLKSQALLLAKNQIEEIKIFREDDFSNIPEGETSEEIFLNKNKFQTELLIDCEQEVCLLTSSVNWNYLNKDHNVTLKTHLTAWTEGVYKDVIVETVGHSRDGADIYLEGRLERIEEREEVIPGHQIREPGDSWNDSVLIQGEKTSFLGNYEIVWSNPQFGSYEYRAIALSLDGEKVWEAEEIKTITVE